MLKNSSGKSDASNANKQVIPAGYEDLVAEFDNIDRAAEFLADKEFATVLELITTNESFLELAKQVRNDSLIIEFYSYNPKKFTEQYVNSLHDLARLIGSPQEITATGRMLAAVPAAIPKLRAKLIENLCTNSELFKKVMNATNPGKPVESLIQAKIKFPDSVVMFERAYSKFYASDLESPSNQPNYAPRP